MNRNRNKAVREDRLSLPSNKAIHHAVQSNPLQAVDESVLFTQEGDGRLSMTAATEPLYVHRYC